TGITVAVRFMIDGPCRKSGGDDCDSGGSGGKTGENPREISCGDDSENRCAAAPERPISLCERLFRIP
ncbi:hypothetical protein ABTE24_20240, partial [Acinetobacter baumannii]